MSGIYSRDKDEEKNTEGDFHPIDMPSSSNIQEEKEEVDERIPSQTHDSGNPTSAASMCSNNSKSVIDQRNFQKMDNDEPLLCPTLEEDEDNSQKVQPGAFRIPGPESELYSDQTLVIGDNNNVECYNNHHEDPGTDQQHQDEHQDLVIAAEVVPDDIDLHDRVHQIVQEALENRERSGGVTHSTAPDVALALADVSPEQPQDDQYSEGTGSENKDWLRFFVIGSILICIIIIIIILLIVLILLLPDQNENNHNGAPPIPVRKIARLK